MSDVISRKPTFRLVRFYVTNSRERILDSAVRLLRSGSTLSLESVAVEAGLVHHHRTKQALRSR